MYEMTVLALVGGTQWPCAFWARSCTRSAGENLGVACLEMCLYSCLTVFLVPCLSSFPGHPVVANDESIKVRMAALAVGLSAIAEGDAGPSTVAW